MTSTKFESKPLFTRQQLTALLLPLIAEQALSVTIGLADTLMVSSVGGGGEWGGAGFPPRRYGITLYRRLIDQDEDTLVKVTDTMTDEGGNRDPRRCLQLPPDVIAAGLTANPR